MSDATIALLTNPEVIAVDQDSAGMQGYRVARNGLLEVWVKPLADGSKAIGLFNRSTSAEVVTANFADIGVNDTAVVRDLWPREELGTFKTNFSADVPGHGAVLVSIKNASNNTLHK